jgi:nucleolar protein 4
MAPPSSSDHDRILLAANDLDLTMSSNARLPSSNAPKSVERTVFVRFRPVSELIRRHHLEDLFSQIGPIKKTSVVHAKDGSSCYGFVKYSTEKDAKMAVSLNHKTISVGGNCIQVIVEAASAGKRADQTSDRNQKAPTATSSSSSSPIAKDRHTRSQASKSQTRLILRNIGFSTTEEHIRSFVSSRFGPVSEVHLPVVPSTAQNEGKRTSQGRKRKCTHRGFGFVTFESSHHAADCVSSSPLVIGKREVTAAYTQNKTVYEQVRQKHSQQQEERKSQASLDLSRPVKKHGQGIGVSESEEQAIDTLDAGGSMVVDRDSFDEADRSLTTGDSTCDNDGGIDKKDDEDISLAGSEGGEKVDENVDKEHLHDAAISERRVVFLRNLPFDTTRHDVFELIRQFGRVESIHLVKKSGGLFQGSCFVHFAKSQAAEKLVQRYNRESKFVSQRQGGTSDHVDCLQLKGRTLLVDWAVSKETATAVVSDMSSHDGRDREGGAKDRRHLYLKSEGRVDDPLEWQALPVNDQQKRQRAWSDKITKLKSPLFFINPTRLSIRNLAKFVDEKALKEICVRATQRGMESKLVSAKDLLQHWRAKGDLSHREILANIQEAELRGCDLLPAFDVSNVKRFIPSVFIDRDFSSPKAGAPSPSRGFGFVEFQHHVHALSCLRELNNNPYYAKYTTGGMLTLPTKLNKKSKRSKDTDEAPKTPRLIVEFTVENMAKARQQAIHRLQQAANQRKQKQESLANKKKERKKSRGALQRERKRKEREETVTERAPMTVGDGVVVNTKKPSQSDTVMRAGESTSERVQPTGLSSKPVKHAKKRKLDPDETKLNDLVESYKSSFAVLESGSAGDEGQASTRKVGKRWFDE